MRRSRAFWNPQTEWVSRQMLGPHSCSFCWGRRSSFSVYIRGAQNSELNEYFALSLLRWAFGSVFMWASSSEHWLELLISVVSGPACADGICVVQPNVEYRSTRRPSVVAPLIYFGIALWQPWEYRRHQQPVNHTHIPIDPFATAIRRAHFTIVISFSYCTVRYVFVKLELIQNTSSYFLKMHTARVTKLDPSLYFKVHC